MNLTFIFGVPLSIVLACVTRCIIEETINMNKKNKELNYEIKILNETYEMLKKKEGKQCKK